MKMSDSIAQLAEALSKAQGQIDDASKGSKNPFFNSKYADLAAVRSVIREPLAANDIAVIQFPRSLDGEVEVETMLTHKSGEFMSETLRLPVGKWDAHGIGSAITYARRYGLMALLGIATDDDDGNAAVEKAPAKPKANHFGLIQNAEEAAVKGSKSLQAYWNGLSEDERNAFTADFRKELKKTAADADAKAEA
jgi:hypothetical protein